VGFSGWRQIRGVWPVGLEVFEEGEGDADLRGRLEVGVGVAECEDGLRAVLECWAGCSGEDAGDVGEDGVAALPGGFGGWLGVGGGGVGGDGRAVEL
jgi:hypothetical protein